MTDRATKYGNNLMNYLTHQLAIVDDPTNHATIRKIRTMDYEQCKQFQIYPQPVLDEEYRIIGFRIIRELKKRTA